MISFNGNKNGYVLHDKVLCLVEIIKVILNIKEQQIIYVTKLGNFDKIYDSIKDYKEGLISNNTTLKYYHHVNGLFPKNNILYTFIYNGYKEIDVRDLSIEYYPDIKKYRYVYERPLYESKEECFANHDLIVNECGVVETKPCTKSILALTKEQKEYLKVFQQAYKNCVNSGINFYYDSDYSELYTLNGKKIKSFDGCGDKGNVFAYRSVFTPVTDFSFDWISFDNYLPSLTFKENE